MKHCVVSLSWCAVLGCSAGAELPRVGGDEGSSTNSVAESSQPLDPMAAKVVVGAAALIPASEGAGLQVPGFTLTLVGADYADVIRCARSFVPVASNGQDARKISPTYILRWEEMRTAFEEAKSDQNNCRIVGNRVIKNQVRDLATPSGEWYYIINPCVEKDRSSRRDRQCSYELSFTEPIAYTSTASEQFISASADLAQSEAAISATFSRLYRRAEMMQRWKETCDQTLFAEVKQKRILSAIVTLVTTGLSVGAGAVLGGTAGTVAQGFLGAFRDLFLSLPDPTWQCPKFLQEQKAGNQDYQLIEPQLQAVVNARSKLNSLNAMYAKMDAVIMESVRSNGGK